jgi:hypothetical protein
MFGDGYRIDVFNPSFSSRFFNNLSSVKKGQTNLKPNVLRLCKLREVGRFFLFFLGLTRMYSVMKIICV